MKMWRSTNCAPGEATCTKLDTDAPLTCNPPMDNQGFADSYFCEKGDHATKRNEIFHMVIMHLQDVTLDFVFGRSVQ